jgi:hypothetical protein
MEFLIQYFYWVILFLVVAILLPRIIPVPDELRRSFGDKASTHPLFYSYTSNFVSAFHAVVTFTAAWLHMKKYGLEFMRLNTPEENSISAFSCAYFTIDFIFGILQRYNDLVTHFHHVFSSSSFVYCLIKGQYGDNLIWALIITEVSNPFMLLGRNAEKTDRFKHLSTPLMLIFIFVFIFSRTYLAATYIPGMMAAPVSLFLKLECSFLCRLNRVHFSVLGLRDHQQTD